MQSTNNTKLQKRPVKDTNGKPAVKKLKTSGTSKSAGKSDMDETKEGVSVFNGGERPVDPEFLSKNNNTSEWKVLNTKNLCFCTSGSCYWDNKDHIYNLVLNQCNLGNNNNKFYIAQVLINENASNEKEKYIFFTRWGRQGAKGQSAQLFCDRGEAHANFTKAKMKKIKGGYTEVLLDYKFIEEVAEKSNNLTPNKEQKTVTINLHPKVQTLVQLIFNKEIFQNSIKEIGYDQKKLPLGK